MSRLRSGYCLGHQLPEPSLGLLACQAAGRPDDAELALDLPSVDSPLAVERAGVLRNRAGAIYPPAFGASRRDE
jgi:hypothetical protein